MNTFFKLPNENSNGIIITGSDFIFTERTCGIAFTAELRFSSALVALFKREYKKEAKEAKITKIVEAKTKNWRCSSSAIGTIANTVKPLCFSVTRLPEEQHVVNPETLVLSLTRLRGFLLEK